MKKQIIISSCITLLCFLANSSQTYAALQAVPVVNSPINQRDKYQTDLFTGSSSYSYPIKVPKGTNDLTPDVSLSYNNQGYHDPSMYTGAGWQLNRDYVQRDINYTPSDTSDD